MSWVRTIAGALAVLCSVVATTSVAHVHDLDQPQASHACAACSYTPGHAIASAPVLPLPATTVSRTAPRPVPPKPCAVRVDRPAGRAPPASEPERS